MADFRFFINRQGPRGPQGLQGEKGDPGNTFTVSEGVNTPTEYTLIFDGGDGNQFETDNLRNPIVDRGGTYVRYDRDNVTQYIGEPDMAVIDETPGIVNLAGKDTENPNASDAVAYELLEKTVDELNTALEGLDDRLDDAEGDITQAQGDISQAQQDIVSLDNRVTTNEGAITSLQSGKADKSTTYTKTEVNSALADKANTVHTHTVSQITNAGALASQNTVDYQTQVTNKPIIPTVGNGTITLTQGGITKGTFTTNQSGNSTIDLDAGGSSSFTEGNAINISDNTISVKYDGTTIGLNASGQLQSLVEEPDMTQYYTKSQVDNLIPGYATTQTAGLVKVGNNLSIAADGTLSADTQAPTAGSGISVNGTAVSVNVDNSTITVNGSGELVANLPGAATSSTLGLVKPDNTTIAVDSNGVISANIPTPETVDQTYDASSTHAQSGVAIAGAGFLTSVPTATTSSLGLVQPDGTSITINDGVISAVSSAPSNMVTTDTDQDISGIKNIPYLNIKGNSYTGGSFRIDSTGSIKYLSNGTSESSSYLSISSNSLRTIKDITGSVGIQGYSSNNTYLSYRNGSYYGKIQYYNGKYVISSSNTSDTKIYKVTGDIISPTIDTSTNFLLEKDMLDGTTISYDSTTGKISTVGNFVPATRTINSKALSSDITLTAEDVGALPDDAVLLKQYSDGLNEYGDLVNTNGILSGFSNDNYASIPGNFFKPGHTIIVKFNYVTKTTARQYILSSEGFLNIDINTNSTQLRTWDNSASTQVNIGSTMTSGSDYYLKIALKDTGKDFYLTTNPSDWGTATTVADTAYLTAEIPNNQVYLGFNITKSNSYWNSTIDSNYIEIYDEDDILIYSSQNNTDIATTSRLGVIKPDGTTLVIDKEGVLSANISSGTGTNLTTNGNLNLIVSEGDIIEATDALPTGVTRAYNYLENDTATCTVTMSNPNDIYAIGSFYIDKKTLIDPTDFEIVLYQVLQYASAKGNEYYKIIDIPNIVNLSWGWNGTAFVLYLYNYYTNTRTEVPNLSYTGMQYFDKAPEIKLKLKSNVLTLSISGSVVYTDNNFVTNTTISNNIGLEDLTTRADFSGILNSVVYLQKSYIKSGGQVTWGLCGDNGVAKALENTYGLVTKNHPMPGDSYEAITVGASGATYNMTNTGWLCFDFGVKANSQYLEVYRTINNTNILLYKNQLYGATNSNIACIIPVKKGDVIAVNYNVTGTKLLYFIPAVS